MKGSPLLRTLGFIAAWLCLFPLVYHLTGSPAEMLPASSRTQPAQSVPTWIHLRFAHSPSSVYLTSGSTTLISLTHPIDLESEVRIDLPMSGSNALLELSVNWEALDTETVVNLSLEPDGLSPRAFHFWAARQCREKVRITW